MKKFKCYLILVGTVSWLMSSWSLTSYAATINWALEGYSIQANTIPQKLEGATEELPFIAASLQESAAGIGGR